jgi:hypothetical protein
MRDHAFQNHDRLIRDRTFWIGIVVYAALFIGVVTAFADGPSIGTLNYSGTLIFGGNEFAPLEAHPFDLLPRAHRHRSAVTLRLRGPGNISAESDWSRNNNAVLSSAIASLPEVSTTSATVSAQTAFPLGKDGGTTALQISLGEQTGFAAEDIAPVPEAATWFAAFLLSGAVAWSNRRRIARRFFGRRKGIVIFMSGAIFAIAFSASGAVNEGSSQLSSLDRESITDAIPSEDNFEVFQRFDRIMNTSTSVNPTTVNLSDNQSLLVAGAPGETVTLSLKNFLMSGSSTFTLQGTATTSFVINVSKRFSLSDEARIILAGDVQWNNVTFNVHGSGTTVKISGSSTLTGVLNAAGRTVKLTDQALVTGRVNPKHLFLLDSSRLVQPVISPEHPPTP